MIPAAMYPVLLLAQIAEDSAFASTAEVVHRVLNFTLFPVGDQDVTIVTVVIVGILIIATWWISHFLQRGLTRAFDSRGVTDKGTTEVTKRLLHYLIMAIGLTLAIQQVGINLSALFAAGALFAVGLGFAMQNIAQNFVSGLILLVERGIKPADIVEVEGRVVRVLKMGIRTTVARTRDDEEIIIPNASLVQSSVKNFTLGDSIFRIRVEVGVTYDSDMRLVRSTLERVAEHQKWRIPTRQPVVLMTDFGDSSVDWQVSCWSDDPWIARRSGSMLREDIWWAFQEEGIVIAFPQLDVHFDPPVAEGFAGLARTA
jgi:small-conductance mechanosensitive channel